MRQYAIGGAALLLLAATMFGASAFTTAEVSRDASIGVTADNESLIALGPGEASTLDSNGELSIDVNPGSTEGVNVNSTYSFGDSASPTSSYAFNITNADSESHSFTLSYENIQNAQGAAAPVNFTVYDSAGTEIGSVTPSSTVQTTVSSGETVYIVLDVDTTGLDDGADLSGDFIITA